MQPEDQHQNQQAHAEDDLNMNYSGNKQEQVETKDGESQADDRSEYQPDQVDLFEPRLKEESLNQ